MTQSLRAEGDSQSIKQRLVEIVVLPRNLEPEPIKYDSNFFRMMTNRFAGHSKKEVF